MGTRILNHFQTAKLTAFVQENFTKCGMSDKVFAAYATDKLGFPVNTIQVTHKRKSLGIPASIVFTGKTSKLSKLEQAVTELATRVEALEARLDKMDMTSLKYTLTGN